MALIAVFCVAACASSVGGAHSFSDAPLRVATWNIEHFGAAGNGCVPRTESEIAVVRDYVRSLNADMISFQEVASEVAAEAIFPQHEWRLFVSRRVYDRPQPQCRQDPSRTMGHMRTGFAVRRGLVAERELELSALGDTAFGLNEEPHGVDVLVRAGRGSVRMLSVHLTSGCSSSERGSEANCKALLSQVPALRSWVDARMAAGEAWVIAGDFNRVWAADDGFWSSALAQVSAVQIISGEGAAVDHIVAAPAHYGVVLEEDGRPGPTTARGLSDHEPVLAKLYLR